jgi:hypothetical protein
MSRVSKDLCLEPFAAYECNKKKGHLSPWHRSLNRFTGATVKWKVR